MQNKRKVLPSFYFALGAIRTRDLSLKRGVLYLLSYKRENQCYSFSPVRSFYQEQFLLSTVFYVYLFYYCILSLKCDNIACDDGS